jgi:leucyl aminopeptidase
MEILFAKPALPKDGSVVIGMLENQDLSATAKKLESKSAGTLTKALSASKFEGKKGQRTEILAPSGMALSRILCIGLGKAEEITPLVLQEFGGKIVSTLQKSGDKSACIVIEEIEGCELSTAEISANVAFGAKIGSYCFNKYKTKDEELNKITLEKITVQSYDFEDAEKAYKPFVATANAIRMTRDLVNEPANIITPKNFTKELSRLSTLGIEVEIFERQQLKDLGMYMMLGVGQGSSNDCKMVVMRWKGNKGSNEFPIALVGKGVTFDSGGISLKASKGMEEMKTDMAGAAVVTGLIKELALKKANVNAVGLVGLVENMPSGTAQRPGDILSSMSGQTVEVLNTDAEGRLVLGDVLSYAQEVYKPEKIIDLATLTGAIITSLGREYAGLFSNNDDFANDIIKSGRKSGEKVWLMPMGSEYDELLSSDIADMKNIGGAEAGSITAAQFLKRFIKKETVWAHIDIAGVTMNKKDKPTAPKGASGFGIKLLSKYLEDFLIEETPEIEQETNQEENSEE